MNWAVGALVFGWLFVLVWVPIVVRTQRRTHPRALFTLFFAEMWERFSYYGMRALLTLYMTKRLFEELGQQDADAKAYGIYGAFNALLYGGPVIGGLLADRLLGFRRAVILGGLFMAAGQFTLAATIDMELPFYAGLGLIVIGNSFFKPNISSFLGMFYERDDPRKDNAFTIFYMGINVGALLAPLTCGYLGEVHDWSYGFLAAGIGIVLGVVVFWINMRVYEDKGVPPDPALLERPYWLGIRPQTLVVLGCILAVPLLAFLLNQDVVVDWLLISAGVLILGYLVATSVRSDDRVRGQRLLVVVILFFFHMLFWMLFEQAGGSLNVLTDRYVDRLQEPGDPESGIPASMFQSVNPFYIIVLAPVFSWMWSRLRRGGMEPRTPTKFILGLAQVGIGFAIIVLGAEATTAVKIPLVFLMLMYLLHTTGELSLSPVGLSVVTKLSPPQIVGFVMGTWFLSISFAHKIAGELGKLTATPEGLSDRAAVEAYTDVYWTWGVLVVGGACIVLLAVNPFVKRWMHGIH